MSQPLGFKFARIEDRDVNLGACVPDANAHIYIVRYRRGEVCTKNGCYPFANCDTRIIWPRVLSDESKAGLWRKWDAQSGLHIATFTLSQATANSPVPPPPITGGITLTVTGIAASVGFGRAGVTLGQLGGAQTISAAGGIRRTIMMGSPTTTMVTGPSYVITSWANPGAAWTALAAAHPTGGFTLRIPAGYSTTHSGTLSWTGMSNVRVYGDNPTTSQLIGSNYQFTAIKLTNCTNIRLEDFRVTANNTTKYDTADAAGIYVSGGSNILVDGVTVTQVAGESYGSGRS